MMTAMLVMEPGSDWPGHVGDETSLVAFCQEGEELVRRTQTKLGTLCRNNQTVRVAVLACNATTDVQTASRRARLARILLAAVTAATFGRLVLSVNGAASHRQRRELLELVGTLTEELRGTTATVSLRFEGVSRRAIALLTKTRAGPTVTEGSLLQRLG
jgi:hypothetical protein